MKETTSKLKQAHAFYLAREYVYIGEYTHRVGGKIELCTQSRNFDQYLHVQPSFWVSFG